MKQIGLLPLMTAKSAATMFSTALTYSPVLSYIDYTSVKLTNIVLFHTNNVVLTLVELTMYDLLHLL